ncbi:hypothetical protein [Antarctobacter jejuensis]|uniref:hypothetical protein n=1 Tax=Antarctobacter jejuensis TaxID=1439938 RepID=UPI003FD0F89F
MKSHSWVVGVLGDLVDYAEKNQLTKTQSVLRDATEVVASEVFSRSPEDEDLIFDACPSLDDEREEVVRLGLRKAPKE